MGANGIVLGWRRSAEHGNRFAQQRFGLTGSRAVAENNSAASRSADGIVWFQRQCAGDFFFCVRHAGLLERDVAEHVVAAEIVGRKQDLGTKFLLGAAIARFRIVAQIGKPKIVMLAEAFGIERDRLLEFDDRLVGIVAGIVGVAEAAVCGSFVPQREKSFLEYLLRRERVAAASIR